MSPAESRAWQAAYDAAVERGAHPGAAARAAERAVEMRRLRYAVGAALRAATLRGERIADHQVRARVLVAALAAAIREGGAK